MTRRRPLSNREREKLYDRERGSNQFPLCNIPFCRQPIRPGQKWVESHYPVPYWLDGDVSGVAHTLCNSRWWREVEAKEAAHIKRTRQKHIGASRSRNPLPCGRFSKWKIKIGGGLKPRLTLSEQMEQTKRARQIGGEE